MPNLTPEERAAKREAAIAGMVARGYTRERAEEVLGMVANVLFHPTKGRFRSNGGPIPTTEDDAEEATK